VFLFLFPFVLVRSRSCSFSFVFVPIPVCAFRCSALLCLRVPYDPVSFTTTRVLTTTAGSADN
jgi:hypothetical protein